jgi:hypothetical protein
MGRPPIGKRAMSGSERQRRYLDRLLQGAQTDATLKAENAALKAEIKKLKASGDGNAALKAELAAAEAPSRSSPTISRQPKRASRTSSTAITNRLPSS